MFIEEDNYLKNDKNKYLRMGIFSTIGDRDEQQDSAGYSISDDTALIVVCDGMGGQKDGKRASKYAVETALEQHESSSNSNQLIDTVNSIDKEINSWEDEEGQPLRSGTTLALVLINKGELNWVSVGDSRIYLYRSGELVQITTDHNYEIALEENHDAGLISDEFYQKEKDNSNDLISFLGVGGLPLIDSNSSPFPLKKNDRIVIMTDGVYKNIDDSSICKCVQNFKNPDDSLRALEYMVKRSADDNRVVRDNMTAAIVVIK